MRRSGVRLRGRGSPQAQTSREVGYCPSFVVRTLMLTLVMCLLLNRCPLICFIVRAITQYNARPHLIVDLGGSCSDYSGAVKGCY